MDKAFKYDVIVCTFNGASFISSQLESILSQTILPRPVAQAGVQWCDLGLSFNNVSGFLLSISKIL